MNICDTPTIVNIKGKAISKIVKNSMAKSIADLCVKTGLCKREDITFTFPPRCYKVN